MLFNIKTNNNIIRILTISITILATTAIIDKLTKKLFLQKNLWSLI